MTDLFQHKRSRLILSMLVGVFVFFGIIFRFYHISRNDFVFYDEGYYLNYNRLVMYLVSRHTPQGFDDFYRSFGAFLRTSLASAKALWFLVVNARVYFLGFDAWFFPRIVSALSGTATLFLLFLFSRRFYEKPAVACLSVVILALLPSHVFYSRLGLQEALSTLLVLLGFYFYVFPAHFSPRAFLAAGCFAAAFFTNYRLIILPVLFLFAEIWLSFSRKEPPHIRKFIWTTLTFFCCVFMIGNLDGGKNTYITFGWMFHQANLAKQQFSFLNLFSFPYYLFRLDNWILGFLFFGNILFIVQKKWRLCFPFLCVCLQMLIFSFASEKGARYLCVMTPFIAMSVAALLYFLFMEQPANRYVWAACGLTMICLMYLKSWALTKSVSDYRTATEFILSTGKQVKFVSTQNYIQNLYVSDPDRIRECPSHFQGLFSLYSQGCRFLVLCPQAYVSLAENQERFSPRLVSFLDFIRSSMTPVKVFPHFNDVLLERFVFDHNEQLLRSVRFLSEARAKGYGELRVYDLSQIMNKALAILSRQSKSGP